MKRSSLSRAIERALLVGCASASSGCCGLWFTRWVDAYHYSNMVTVDPKALPPELRNQNGYTADPDKGTCEHICGDGAVSCSLATLEIPTPEPQPHVRCDYQRGPSELRSIPPSSFDKQLSKSRECQYMCRADGRAFKDCEVFFDQQPKSPLVAICTYYVPSHCASHIPSGRAPETLEVAVRIGNVGDYFARAAWLEQMSVLAFEDLAEQLRAQGAPRGLVARARRAARDERGHARIFGDWAQRAGRAVPPAAKFPERSTTLLDLALANAAEGCVIETYSALVATHQARHAAPHLRRALAHVAAEETEHAQLSWDIARWAQSLLEPHERKLVDDELARARERLSRRLPDLPATISTELGLPSHGVARRLFAAINAELWSKTPDKPRARQTSSGSRARRRAALRARL